MINNNNYYYYYYYKLVSWSLVQENSDTLYIKLHSQSSISFIYKWRRRRFYFI